MTTRWFQKSLHNLNRPAILTLGGINECVGGPRVATEASRNGRFPENKPKRGNPKLDLAIRALGFLISFSRF